MTDRPTGLRRSTLAALVAAALIGGAVPVWAAVLSQPTGIIEGRAPTATGNLYALLPDGATKVTNNVVVSQAATPNQFTVSADTTGLIPSDLDGDTGLTLTPNMAGATLVWKQSNGTPLTPAQLAAPLVSNFPNSTVTLEVQAPVTVTSTTGLPTSAGPQNVVTTYAVKVPLAAVPMPASVKLSPNRVNIYLFATSTGVPTIAFPGANFDIYMNGSNTSTNTTYRWAVDRAHVTVDTSGRVTIHSKPSAAQASVTVTATSKSTGVEYYYTFKTKEWYIKHASNSYYPTSTAEVCPAAAGATPSSIQLAGVAPRLGSSTNPAGFTIVQRGVGSLYGEWGNITHVAPAGTYPGMVGSGGQNPNSIGVWARETATTGHYGQKMRASLWTSTAGVWADQNPGTSYMLASSADVNPALYTVYPATIMCVSNIGS